MICPVILCYLFFRRYRRQTSTPHQYRNSCYSSSSILKWTGSHRASASCSALFSGRTSILNSQIIQSSDEKIQHILHAVYNHHPFSHHRNTTLLLRSLPGWAGLCSTVCQRKSDGSAQHLALPGVSQSERAIVPASAEESRQVSNVYELIKVNHPASAYPLQQQSWSRYRHSCTSSTNPKKTFCEQSAVQRYSAFSG